VPDFLEIKTDVVCAELKPRGIPVFVTKRPTSGKKLALSQDRWLMVCSCTGNANLVILWAERSTDLVMVAGQPRAKKGSAFVQPPLAEPGSRSVAIPIQVGEAGALSQRTLAVQFTDVEFAKFLVFQINYVVPADVASPIRMIRFDFCLKTPSCVTLFEAYVNKEHSPENLEFLKYVDASMAHLSAAQISHMWGKWLTEDINISAEQRTALSDAILGADGAVKAAYTAAELTIVKAALATAREEIYNLLLSDTFKRFVETGEFPAISE